MFKKSLLSAAVISALAAGSLTMPSAAHATVADPTGKYTAVSPARIADSRTGNRIAHRLVAGQTTALQIAGVAGVPSAGVQSVVVNVTAVNPSTSGYLTIYPSGAARPNTSNSNFPKGWNGATTTTVPVGADGKIAIYAGGASVDVVVDVLGWYAAKGSTATPGSLYMPEGPDRITDTRKDGDGPLLPGKKLDAGYYFVGMPATMKVTGLAVNITAVGQGKGYMTAYARNASKIPTSSIINYAKGETAPNFAILPVSGSNSTGYYFTVANTSGGSAHLIIDLVGFYYTDTQNLGLTHQAFTPTRVADTRSGLGIGKQQVAAGSTRAMTLPTKLLDVDRTAAVEGTITAANPTATTYLAITDGWDDGAPTISNLNVTVAKNRSNAFTSGIGGFDTPELSVYNGAGKVDVITDLSGRFDATDELIASFPTPVSSTLTKLSGTRAFQAFAHGKATPAHRGSIR